MNLQRILIALKPWERSLPLTVQHARQLAQNGGARIELLTTVFDAHVAGGRERLEPAARTMQDRMLAAARVELERLAAAMRHSGAKVTTNVVWGASAYEAIAAAAEDWSADLLVVGAHEPQTLHTRLTDTDWQLIRRVSCPLLVVKNASFDGYRTILAAVDPLHAHAEPYGLDRAVLAAGRCFARAFGSGLRAVYAYPGPSAFELASAVQVSPGVLYGVENVEAVHRRAVNELAEQYGIPATDVDLIEGSPAAALVDVVAQRGAGLVIVGEPQRRGVLAAVADSTAEAVAASVACDVLIVPAQRPAHAALTAGAQR